MKERPILFSAPMVNALLDGSKTQTRRAMKNPPSVLGFRPWLGRQWERLDGKGHMLDIINCPYGQPGDRLYVKETFAHHVQAIGAKRDEDGPFVYAADGEFSKQYRLGDKWKPSIFMPRCASRILLEIADIRVERLQDISEEDAKAEGCFALGDCECTAVRQYRELWESINGAGSWDANPYVWVIEFTRIKS